MTLSTSLESNLNYKYVEFIDFLFYFQVFSRLREEVPKFRHKVVAIPGDCAVAGLGLNLTDRQTLISNVSINKFLYF